ncbi:beta-hydroxyacyl-ACP dehydratase [Paenibacillus sp. N1-5-1-14]|uniref:3-hydroxyacyl-ACP dehydratase FabZ family protein n=1 Tax=Paenibacillus radicibacter TaxID=2972488 RepID=UPI002158D962|nr:3-hydroxyacyl-ACP dehydratase FabZ family protein [Paenibacillus radicibacter]MCR8643543.1 beta-hydroxyacyl-ACP dehydratase [Paenibacillus radicibacter]
MTDISSTIPHRYPFLMIDRIIGMEQGKWARGIKNVTMNEWYITNSTSYMPHVMLVEALAQLGAFATLNSEGNRLGFLSSTNGIQFVGNAYPGDCVELFYEVIKQRRGFIVGRGEAKVNDQVIVRADEIMIYVQA